MTDGENAIKKRPDATLPKEAEGRVPAPAEARQAMNDTIVANQQAAASASATQNTNQAQVRASSTAAPTTTTSSPVTATAPLLTNMVTELSNTVTAEQLATHIETKAMENQDLLKKFAQNPNDTTLRDQINDNSVHMHWLVQEFDDTLKGNTSASNRITDALKAADDQLIKTGSDTNVGHYNVDVTHLDPASPNIRRVFNYVQDTEQLFRQHGAWMASEIVPAFQNMDLAEQERIGNFFDRMFEFRNLVRGSSVGTTADQETQAAVAETKTTPLLGQQVAEEMTEAPATNPTKVAEPATAIPEWKLSDDDILPLTAKAREAAAEVRKKIETVVEQESGVSRTSDPLHAARLYSEEAGLRKELYNAELKAYNDMAADGEKITKAQEKELSRLREEASNAYERAISVQAELLRLATEQNIPADQKTERENKLLSLQAERNSIAALPAG